jgi:rhodanese-related sulfurtransferase
VASGKAAGLAAKAGYEKVYVFRGGLPEWIMAGYPTKSIEKLPDVKIPSITVQDLKGILDAKEDLVLLDIRIPDDEKKLWIDCEKRRAVSFNELPEKYSEIPKGKKLVILDKIGKRAAVASRYLAAKGFDNIVKVSGGMNQWAKSGLPIKIGN